MEDRKRNVAVGFTAVSGLAGLVVLLLLFGYVPQFLEKGYLLNIRLPDAGGLHRDSRVTLRGIDIGRVEEIKLLPPPSTDVHVIVKQVDDRVHGTGLLRNGHAGTARPLPPCSAAPRSGFSGRRRPPAPP